VSWLLTVNLIQLADTSQILFRVIKIANLFLVLVDARFPVNTVIKCVYVAVLTVCSSVHYLFFSLRWMAFTSDPAQCVSPVQVHSNTCYVPMIVLSRGPFRGSPLIDWLYYTNAHIDPTLLRVRWCFWVSWRRFSTWLNRPSFRRSWSLCSVSWHAAFQAHIFRFVRSFSFP